MNVRQMLVLGVLGLPLPVSLAAQQPLPLTPGQRVRVTAPSAGLHEDVATVVAISTDTLVLERLWAGQPLRSAVPLGSVQALESVQSTHDNAGTGAVFGGFLGFVAGALADAACQRAGGFPQICPFKLVGMVLGAGLGASVGGGRITERWEPVPLDRIRVGLTAHAAGRLGLSVGFSF